MTHRLRIKKGLDIPLEGEASSRITDDSATRLFGLVPDDFPGYTWKCSLRPGDNVSAGQELLHAKEDEALLLTSPVSGTVKDIVRGERRKILAVVVEKSDEQVSAPTMKAGTSADEILQTLCRSGLFAMMRQRPFDIVPSAKAKPRDIFVTAFDSAPLASALYTDADLGDVQAGVDALSKLTEGSVYVTFRAGESLSLTGCEIVEVEGPHPAGNVSVHINRLRPVDKGDIVWTLDITTLRRIGRLMRLGELDYSARVAVTGPEAVAPHLVETLIGAYLPTLLKGFLPDDTADLRIISGNVLTGTRADLSSPDCFLRYPYRQVTVIREGAHADEFMGWASVDPKKYSVKRSFPAFLRGLKHPFPFDARIKGGHRAMILSGEYDKVFPMDIYPEYLLKAIMAKDIDKMEQLGIYEVAPEDFALPEFVDTSKIELQKAVREGLDYLRSEI